MIEFIDEPAIISPEGIPEAVGIEIAITTFSTHLFEDLLEQTCAKPCGIVRGGVDRQLYACEIDGKKAIVYLSPIGAPAAVCVMEEMMACGVKHVVAFGICGALVPTSHQTLIVPTRAYRDEGTSRHYMPDGEYIDLPNSGGVQAVLDGLGLHTLTGGVWTTDGFYRETRSRADAMLANGCVAVDMECSALQAAANFRGNRFYTFFITADSLAGETWEPNDVIDLKTTDASSVAVAAAIRLAGTL